ncbi:Protoheme IX farnesyltransferase, mitochondrial [Lobosporangium transversale]|uniref:Protoheme IX farnesyltransferase, mitochondrial n=1 Tax=Lobosporangium transversale TaxID=64571 RepID=A0A1Y2GRB9_9FUNG|nr:UbiA prenyltransferase family-domain-containing protein [Lobosporangium transversale]KAF9904136.1 Protoheme IX farnesyltransferase, mitochondrial [Lobosporangium transversale]ORZ17414.1 UbiA prenyltransferase family-domain-containing protein [Lobosporangium transversale]|eukprot:XP_021881801.1 UbiA prenyltransferase family-domain-containing protein [Lobosporangium transversale]
MAFQAHRVISGRGLIRSECSRGRVHTHYFTRTYIHTTGSRLQNRHPIAIFHSIPSTTSNHQISLKRSRIIITRTSSSAPVRSAAALPTGAQNIFTKHDQDQDFKEGFFTSQSIASLSSIPLSPSTSTAIVAASIPSSTSTSASTNLAPEGFQDYDIRWKEIKKPTLTGLVPIYMDLAKARLGALVTLTTMAGYAMTPTAASLPTLFSLTVGTALCITSANAYNQFVEPPYDAQMSRTRNRILVRKAVSPLHAWSFATVTGIGGVSLLATAVNPLTAALGAANLFLYASVYTPMKRMSIANTWVGAIVGAIPPMMGWAACTNSLDPEAWLLGGLLYAWQFPHFNSLAWNLRADYSKAGYRMMAVTDPKLNARVSLRYTLALVPLVTLAPYLDMTTWWFAIDGNIVNAVILAGATNFWRKRDDKSARQLFFGSLIYLPIILALMMIHKKGHQSIEAEPVLPSQHALEDDDDEYEYVDEDEDDGEEEEEAQLSSSKVNTANRT